MRALLLALTLSLAGCGARQTQGAQSRAAWVDDEALAAWRDETPSAIVRLRPAPRTTLLAARRPTPASRPPGLAGAHIDVRFRRAPLADALRLLADQAGVGLVVAEGVAGVVDLELRDVTPAAALEALAAAHGAEVRWRGAIAVVTGPRRAAR